MKCKNRGFPPMYDSYLRQRKSHVAVDIEACPEGKLRRPVLISDWSKFVQFGL